MLSVVPLNYVIVQISLPCSFVLYIVLCKVFLGTFTDANNVDNTDQLPLTKLKINPLQNRE